MKLVTAFLLTIFASSAMANSCGWIVNNHGIIWLTDSIGRYILASPTLSTFYDGTNGLVKTPKTHVVSGTDPDPVQVFCGCARLEIFPKSPDYDSPFASVITYQSLDLARCFQDKALPSLTSLLDQ